MRNILIGLFVLLLIGGGVYFFLNQEEEKKEEPVVDEKEEVEEEEEVKGFVTSNPVSEFTEEEIISLGIDFSGSDAEIADEIYDWQVENMKYVAFGDVSDAMRWNYFMPGIYPTSDMIVDMKKDGKIEGLCYNYATIYCSIANYYGLECRVTAMKEKPSDLDSRIDKRTTTGMAPHEYDRLLERIEELDLYYSYETVRKAAKETSSHYRAEVKLNDEWVIKDASVAAVGGTYNDLYDFFEVDWLEAYDEKLFKVSE